MFTALYSLWWELTQWGSSCLNQSGVMRHRGSRIDYNCSVCFTSKQRHMCVQLCVSVSACLSARRETGKTIVGKNNTKKTSVQSKVTNLNWREEGEQGNTKTFFSVSQVRHIGCKSTPNIHRGLRNFSPCFSPHRWNILLAFLSPKNISHLMSLCPFPLSMPPLSTDFQTLFCPSLFPPRSQHSHDSVQS